MKINIQLLFCTVLNYTLLCCTTLCCTVLCCTVSQHHIDQVSEKIGERTMYYIYCLLNEIHFEPISLKQTFLYDSSLSLISQQVSKISFSMQVLISLHYHYYYYYQIVSVPHSSMIKVRRYQEQDSVNIVSPSEFSE